VLLFESQKLVLSVLVDSLYQLGVPSLQKRRSKATWGHQNTLIFCPPQGARGFSVLKVLIKISPPELSLLVRVVAKPCRVSSEVFLTPIFAVMFPTEMKLASSSLSYFRTLQGRKSSALWG
jgi:hypothetical protein